MKANDQNGTFNGPAEVRLVRTLPGPIERIWEYLTDPEKRARWFASGSMEPRAGGKMTLRFRHREIAPDETPPAGYAEMNEQGKEMNATVTRWDPPRVLGFTFGSDQESEVIFELTPQGKQVQLVVTHRATGGDIPYMHDFASGWHTHLAQLIALLEGAPRPPFWPMHTRLKAEYQTVHSALTK